MSYRQKLTISRSSDDEEREAQFLKVGMTTKIYKYRFQFSLSVCFFFLFCFFLLMRFIKGKQADYIHRASFLFYYSAYFGFNT